MDSWIDACFRIRKINKEKLINASTYDSMCVVYYVFSVKGEHNIIAYNPYILILSDIKIQETKIYI